MVQLSIADLLRRNYRWPFSTSTYSALVLLSSLRFRSISIKIEYWLYIVGIVNAWSEEHCDLSSTQAQHNDLSLDHGLVVGFVLFLDAPNMLSCCCKVLQPQQQKILTSQDRACLFIGKTVSNKAIKGDLHYDKKKKTIYNNKNR